MKWITFFSNDNIPYYIYRLNKEDSVIVNCSEYKKNKSIIILYGSLYIVKNFANNETIPLAILKKDNILNLNNLKIKSKYYYKLTALEKTYIVSFTIPNLQKKRKINNNLFTNIIESYKKTIFQYEKMNEVVSHKYAKNRVIQLILLLFIEFGTIRKTEIQIPFKISQKNLATLSHTPKNNLNKIMNYLYKNTPIKYSYKKKIHIQNIFHIN